MASSSQSDDPSIDQEIRLYREGDTWVAKDVDTGVTSQGERRAVALANLDEAVALYEGEIGRDPTDDELRERGIDPEDNRTGETNPPDVLE
jgi:predicted RNase H-like HicB family nuclease